MCRKSLSGQNTATNPPGLTGMNFSSSSSSSSSSSPSNENSSNNSWILIQPSVPGALSVHCPPSLPSQHKQQKGLPEQSEGRVARGKQHPQNSLLSSEDMETLDPSEMRSLKFCHGERALSVNKIHPFATWTFNSCSERLQCSTGGKPKALS